jgi:glycosyltransferase involved in cell wall biosynthesis
MGGLPWGGSEELWHKLANHALLQNVQVLVSVYDWGKLHEKVESLSYKGAIIHTRSHYNPNAGIVERVFRFVKKRRPASDPNYKKIIDFRPDCVFISQGDSFDLAIHHRPLYNLLRRHKIPYSFVCHSHVQYSLIPQKEIYPDAIEVFQHARYVYFVSKRQWQLTERRLATRIPNGFITWNPLNLELPSSPLSWPTSDTRHFAMVANLIGTKGHDTAFEVLAGENWRNKDWILNIYGEGYGKRYLNDLSIFYGIADKVIFHGHTHEIKTIWQMNHILLIPSASEGLPISLVEAMSCGRPAVVTDIGGNIELITENETGFIASSPTSNAFAVALEKAWDARDNWREMGLNAFRKVSNITDTKPEEKIYKHLTSSIENLSNG